MVQYEAIRPVHSACVHPCLGLQHRMSGLATWQGSLDRGEISRAALLTSRFSAASQTSVPRSAQACSSCESRDSYPLMSACSLEGKRAVCYPPLCPSKRVLCVLSRNPLCASCGRKCHREPALIRCAPDVQLCFRWVMPCPPKREKQAVFAIVCLHAFQRGAKRAPRRRRWTIRHQPLSGSERLESQTECRQSV